MLLCSRVSEDTGHVTQICVAPGLRREGLGRLLLSHSLAQLASRGLRYVTLTVTGENREAAMLYAHCGFGVRHTFDAVVWDRREGER